MYLPSFPLVRLVSTVPVKLYFRPAVRGVGHIPPSGPFVVASNHASVLDPYMIGYASKRRQVGFMAKEELFRIPVFGWCIRIWGAFPVRRGSLDEAGIQRFYDFIHRDKPVTIFPEGTRTPDGEVHEGKKGVGMLLQKVRVPVVPVYVGGTFAAWPKGRAFPRPVGLSVTFGPPVPLEDLYALPREKETYRRITARVMEHIRALRD
jgi:1-acyl-sn-glycerol-3-phosphate acyltransferase